ncbi:MAG: phospholipase D-like domain-containing protein, partial [Bdellovibrionota bacterium]
MKSDETVFVSGDQYFEAVLTDIGAARRSIEMESYIFKADGLGRRVVEALRKAAGRGVNVRILLDGFGTPPWEHHPFNAENGSSSPLPDNLTVRSYHPPSRFDLINRRNHRKMIAIDSEIVYAGGINVDSRYLSEVYGKAAWQDASVRLANSNAAQPIIRSFESLWNSKPL